MDEYCKKNNIIYTRYSDDLIFSSQTKLTDFATIASDILQDTSENKFLLNTFKSKYLDKTKRVKILGLVITPDGHITVPKERKGNIRKLLYFYTSNQAKFKEFLFENYQGKLSKAYGELNYINDIDIDFVDFLRKKYGNYTIDKFLHGKKNDK
jgi:RNA-directed DNA polymerase